MKLDERVYLVGSGDAGISISHQSDCHIYLIDGGGELALVDAGTGLGVAETLANVAAHGFSPEDVKFLFLTHFHADHAGGAAHLYKAIPGLKVAVSKRAAEWARNGDEQKASLDMGKKGGYYEPSYRMEPCPVDIELVDGQAVEVGDLRITTHDAPGHSSAHVVFTMEDAGKTYLFCGDVLFFGGKILLQSIWDCALQAHLQSIRDMSGLGVDVFLPGHGCFSMAGGQRHIEEAIGWMERCLVPPSLF
jgi:glyoxylase-like metal-dependent hydrolase (beta-lactamase superfamily II)